MTSSAVGLCIVLAIVPHASASPAPWWICAKVALSGPDKDMGSYTVGTFSPAQQAQYGIDEMGYVLDQAKFAAAVPAECAGLGSSPPRASGPCCYSIGYGAMMAPCCLKTTSGFRALYCPGSRALGGATGFTWGQCPATAAEAHQKIKSGWDTFSMKTVVLWFVILGLIALAVMLAVNATRPTPAFYSVE